MIFGSQKTYFKKFAFQVEIAGILSAAFTTCSEISIEVAVVEHKEGGALVSNKQPGMVTIPNVTLTRGAAFDLDAYGWMQQVVAAEALVEEPAHQRVVSVIQTNRAGRELRRWALVGAWPTKWKASEWDNNANEAAVEELVLAYRYPTLGGDSAV